METKANIIIPQASKKEGVKIFIIDDDPIYNTVLQHKLKNHPEYIINTFKAGEHCFRHIEKLDPDIVILDYRLNDLNPRAMNGIEILKRLKVIKPDIAVLMISSQGNYEVVSNSIKNGAFDYIEKNDRAFVKLQLLIDKILKEKKLSDISKMQRNYATLLIVLGVALIGVLVTLSFSVSKNISWIVLALIVGYVGLFTLINRTKFATPTI